MHDRFSTLVPEHRLPPLGLRCKGRPQPDTSRVDHQLCSSCVLSVLFFSVLRSETCPVVFLVTEAALALGIKLVSNTQIEFMGTFSSTNLVSES